MTFRFDLSFAEIETKASALCVGVRVNFLLYINQTNLLEFGYLGTP